MEDQHASSAPASQGPRAGSAPTRAHTHGSRAPQAHARAPFCPSLCPSSSHELQDARQLTQLSQGLPELSLPALLLLLSAKEPGGAPVDLPLSLRSEPPDNVSFAPEAARQSPAHHSVNVRALERR